MHEHNLENIMTALYGLIENRKKFAYVVIFNVLFLQLSTDLRNSPRTHSKAHNYVALFEQSEFFCVSEGYVTV